MLTMHSTKISSKATKMTATLVNNPDQVFDKEKKDPLTSPVYQLARITNLFAVFVITVIYEKLTINIFILINSR